MKVIVFLAEGFEEVEALTVVDYLRRMDIQVDMVSISGEIQVKGAHKIQVKADKIFSQLEDLESYDGLVIPGGLPGATNLRDHEDLIETVKSLNHKGKLIAAICAGPIVLDKAGVLSGRNVTCYPGIEDQLEGINYKVEPVVTDGNIITARGPYYAVHFAIEIVKYLLGEESAEELKGNILLNEGLQV